MGSKNESYIEFPIKRLDLSSHVKNASVAPIYDLYAVINHSGTLTNGHYTSFAFNPCTNAWYLFNDSTVTKVDESAVCSELAYVLFYKQRGTPNNADFNKIKRVPST
eukprot:TRINITY_DN4920_c0_g3_i4.p1 TRINITY_DN4920_c0_g3~~TRINITY_DN4920_c0_g3_i4.p1  ORF type:complete len:107 (+),score=3.64 TRINITY_DN4920_c0_g3_i4:93-413(+)